MGPVTPGVLDRLPEWIPVHIIPLEVHPSCVLAVGSENLGQLQHLRVLLGKFSSLRGERVNNPVDVHHLPWSCDRQLLQVMGAPAERCCIHVPTHRGE